MYLYHYYFFLIKILLLILIVLMLLQKIPYKGKYYILLESIFKFSLGLFIILYFSNNNCNTLNKHDRLLIIISGFILIFLVDYKDIYRLFYKNKK